MMDIVTVISSSSMRYDLTDCSEKRLVAIKILNMKLTSYSLYGKKLWGDDDFCKEVLNIDGSKIKSNSLCDKLNLTFGNSWYWYCEPRHIDDDCNPDLHGEIGLFCTNFMRKNSYIFKVQAGNYYTFNNWWEYGIEKQENNVIGFECNGINCIFEALPKKYDSLGHG